MKNMNIKTRSYLREMTIKKLKATLKATFLTDIKK